ncbi:hypothetical protein [Falsirhodobacter xinxiangensis]|uniref:hypothetical protein n=1 Tax=Falsirhodobacter xinxiangensis TaxID=2530049 RepID=UPI0010AAC72B|nr:hypothetical protein [Rhodobacter xinxiangensis]
MSELPLDERVTRYEHCSLPQVRRVAAMLDQNPDRWSNGDHLPRGWQFILMGADTTRSQLRADGFPGLGVALPDVGLPQLVLGGRSVEFMNDIVIGQAYRRESYVQSVKHKEVSSGPMAIVTVAHEVFLEDGEDAAFAETQTYILMAKRPESGNTPSRESISPHAAMKTVTPDDTLLFQYSALGFNSHRIHIDRAYAREVDGYPDLVVNGGLATLLLTEYLRTDLGHQINGLKARHMAPLFVDRPQTLIARQEDDLWTLRIHDENGRLAVDIQARATPCGG